MISVQNDIYLMAWFPKYQILLLTWEVILKWGNLFLSLGILSIVTSGSSIVKISKWWFLIRLLSLLETLALSMPQIF